MRTDSRGTRTEHRPSTASAAVPTAAARRAHCGGCVADDWRPVPTTFIAVTSTMRGGIENVIEELLQLLDEIDGDADLEPSLGAPAPA